MGQLSNAVVDLWRRSPLSRTPRLHAAHVGGRAQIARTLPRRQLVLIGDPPKWATMACPCGTGHTIDLNIGNPGGPQWRIITGGRRPSLHPSIDVRDPGGRCHFWLRNGCVDWVQPPRTTREAEE